MKVTIIDISGGWRWGFPRVYDKPEEQSFTDWLVEKGVPKEFAKLDYVHQHCRMWEEERDVQT